jgi:hypothetical protein
MPICRAALVIVEISEALVPEVLAGEGLASLSSADVEGYIRSREFSWLMRSWEGFVCCSLGQYLPAYEPADATRSCV